MIVRGMSFLVKMFVYYPKKIARLLLVKAALFLSRFPGLRSKIVLFLNRYPVLKSRLKALTIGYGAVYFARNYTRKRRKKMADEDAPGSGSFIGNDYFEKKRLQMEDAQERIEFSQGLNAEKKSPLEKWFY